MPVRGSLFLWCSTFQPMFCLCLPPHWGGIPGIFDGRGSVALGASPWGLPEQRKWSRPYRHVCLLWWTSADPPVVFTSWRQLGPLARLRRPPLWPMLPATEDVHLLHLTGKLLSWQVRLPYLSPYTNMGRCRRTPWGGRGETPPDTSWWGFSRVWGRWQTGRTTS